MSAHTEEKPIEKYLTPLAVLAGAIIVAIALTFGHAGTPKPADDKATAGAVNIANVKTAGASIVGEKNAPVTIAVWFDYQCPFCKRFELDTISQVYENYVKSGKVRIVYKDFQFLGPDSDTAGLFARAVYDAYPDRFYDWLTAIMNAQDEEHAGFGNLESVTTLTRGIAGIDTDRVLKLMNEKKTVYQTAMAADKTEATGFGINGTPGAIVGTTVISGAQPYAKVQALIDAELAKKK